MGFVCRVVCERELLWGKPLLTPLTPDPSQHSWNSSAGLFAGRCCIVLSSAVPKFSAAVTPGQHKPSSGQVTAGHLLLPPGARKPLLFGRDQSQVLECPEAVLLWVNRSVPGRTSTPLLGFGCSYNSCQERNWATVSLHMSNLTYYIGHPTVPPFHPYGGKTGSYLS